MDPLDLNVFRSCLDLYQIRRDPANSPKLREDLRKYLKMILGVKLDKNDVATKYIADTHRRLNSGYSFRGGVAFETNPSSYSVFFCLSPVFPSIKLLATYLIVIGAGLYLSFGILIKTIFILSALFYGTDYFRSRHFNIWVLKKGLKKAGYSGDFTLLEDYQIYEVLENGTNGNI